MAKKENTANNSHNVKKQTLTDSLSFAGNEAYKQLRTNIIFSLPGDKKSHIIGITSAEPGEGKSTTAVNLAYSLAQLKKKVLIVEADMRRPFMAQRLDLKAAPGLSELLTGQKEAKEILQRADAGDVHFYAVTAGALPPNPSELLTNRMMKRYLNLFGTTFDYIILDLPPVNLVTDAAALSKESEGYVVVARQDKNSARDLRKAIDKLKIVDGKVLGFVLNDVKPKRGYGYESYQKYYHAPENGENK